MSKLGLSLNCIDNETTFNKKNYLFRAAERLGLTDITDCTGAKAPPDFVLNIEPFDFIKGKRWTGIWAIDTLIDKDIFHKHNHDVDDFFVAGTTQRNVGIWFAPEKERVLFQACDPELHRRMPEIEQDYDFVMCGTTSGDKYMERWHAHNLLSQAFKGKDFGKNHRATEYMEYYNHAKVQFIRSMGVGGRSAMIKGVERTVDSQGEIAQRFFECLAVGPVLTNYVSDLQLTGLVEGEDYLAYKDDEEMLFKMGRLLSDENYRMTIAKNGRENTNENTGSKRKHKYKRIFRKILQ